MGFYQFKRTQNLPASIEVMWDFISRAENLSRITPPEMRFVITSDNLPEKIYCGMIIAYKVSPLPLFRTTWVTEITQVQEGEYFVDEQRVGPYKMWHHQHILRPTAEGGTFMEDIVSYRPPAGLLGDALNAVMIQRKLNAIFNFRTEALERLFGTAGGEQP